MILMIADKGIAAPPWLPSAPHSAVGIEHLGLPWPELRARVKEDRLPSGIIHKAIARFHPDTREWDGSELADRYLACLAAYADLPMLTSGPSPRMRYVDHIVTVPVWRLGRVPDLTALD